MAVTLVIGFGGYFAVPAMIPNDLVKARIDEHVSRWTGNAYRLNEASRIAVEPGFDVIVSDASFVPVAETDNPLTLTSDQGRASLRILPMLFGRIEIANLALLRPEIALPTQFPDPLENASPDPRGEPPGRQARALGEVILADGTVRFDGAEGIDYMSGVDLRLSSREASEAVALDGAMTLGARHVQIDLQLDDLGALASDAGTPGKLTFRVGPRQDDDQDDGITSDLGMSDRTTDLLLQMAGAIGLSDIGFSAMAVEGTFSLTRHAIDISGATFSVGGVELEGHLRAESADRHIIAQLLELPDAVGATVANAGDLRDGRWREKALQMPWLSGLRLNVDLSGDDIAFGDVSLDAAAITLAISDDTATLDLAGSEETLGNVQTEFSLDYASGEEVGFTASGRADDVSVGKTMQLLATIGPPPLVGTAQLPEGTMNATFDLNAKGRTLDEWMDRFDGSVQAQLTDGSLTGTDLVATLETLVRGRKFMTEEDGPLIPAAGRTRFDKLDAQIDFASGEAIVSGIQIAGERFGINMLGEVQLAEGTMNVGGDAVLLPVPGTEAEVGDILVNLPFGLGGTVFKPVVAPGVPTVTTAQVGPYVEGR